MSLGLFQDGLSMDYRALRSEYPYLPIDDEFRLFKLYKEHKDKRSFQVLFLSGLHLVHHATMDFIKKRGGEYNDYFQVGVIAFMRAFEKFDPSRGIRLNQFAHTSMRRKMNRYSETEDRLVAFKTTENWQKLKSALIKKLSADKTVSVTEVWIRKFVEEHPEYDIEDIKFVLPFVRRWEPYSLDSPLQSDGTESRTDLTWLDTLSDKKRNTERQAIGEMDLSQIYDWTVEAVREQKKSGNKKFTQNLNFYNAIIDGLIFARRVQYSTRDIARPFEVSPQTVVNSEKTIRQMIQDQFPHSGYETFQKSTSKREHAKTLTINGMDIQHTYNWIMAAVRKEESFRKEPAYYEAIINGLIFTFFPRSVSDIAKKFKVHSDSVVKTERIIRKMIEDHFLP